MHHLFRMWIHFNRRLLLGCLGTGLLGVVPTSQAQTPATGETGRPFVTLYTPAEYGAHPQNTAIVQDERG